MGVSAGVYQILQRLQILGFATHLPLRHADPTPISRTRVATNTHAHLPVTQRPLILLLCQHVESPSASLYSLQL